MTLLDDKCMIKVSSVLNRNTKSYGKKFLNDGNDDTCWNSDKGENQWINLIFEEAIPFQKDDKLTFSIQFQGGFCCGVINVTATLDDKNTIEFSTCYPKDINSTQTFLLSSNTNCVLNVKSIKFTMENTTDFFGRIIIYHFNVDHVHENS